MKEKAVFAGDNIYMLTLRWTTSPLWVSWRCCCCGWCSTTTSSPSPSTSPSSSKSLSPAFSLCGTASCTTQRATSLPREIINLPSLVHESCCAKSVIGPKNLFEMLLFNFSQGLGKFGLFWLKSATTTKNFLDPPHGGGGCLFIFLKLKWENLNIFYISFVLCVFWGYTKWGNKFKFKFFFWRLCFEFFKFLFLLTFKVPVIKKFTFAPAAWPNLPIF